MFEINVFSISVTDSGGRDDVIHRWITVQTARNEFQRKGWDRKKKRSTGSQLMSGLVCFWLGGLFMQELKKKKRNRDKVRDLKKLKKTCWQTLLKFPLCEKSLVGKHIDLLTFQHLVRAKIFMKGKTSSYYDAVLHRAADLVKILDGVVDEALPAGWKTQTPHVGEQQPTPRQQ